jgi:hypothetical protein
MFPFGEDVMLPSKFPTYVYPEVFDMVLAGKLHIVRMDGRARSTECGERYVNRFEDVGLHSPFLEPDSDCAEIFEIPFYLQSVLVHSANCV